MSAIPGPFTGTAAERESWFLHTLTLAQGTAWGNSENTKTSATMESNGIEGTSNPGTGPTINSINTGWGYVWPITLVTDIQGRALTSPFNLALRVVKAACLVRSTSSLPLEAGVMFGFCSSADPATAQQLVCVGNTYETSQLGKTMAGKKISGTQTIQRGTTGQNGTAGCAVRYQAHGSTNTSGNNHSPLDSTFNLVAAQSNMTQQNATAIPVDGITHIFCCFLYTVAASVLTPTIRADFAIQIMDDIPWA
jgi:hypothetical protein